MAMEREEKTFLRAMAYVLIAFVLMVWALWLISPRQAQQPAIASPSKAQAATPASASARVAVEPDFAPSQAVEGPADPIIVRTMAQLPLVENGFEVVGPTARKPLNPAPGQRYLDTDLNSYSIWNGTSWFSVNTSAGIGVLDDIGDVNVPGPATGEFLGWDGAAWSNQTVSMGELEDVDLTGINDNQYLSYASATSTWVPVSLSTDDLSNFNLTSLQDEQFIRYDSGTNKLINETVDIPADERFFVVTDYGATFGDTTDDTLTIQAAIDAAEAYGPGATVYFPRGTYYVAGSVGNPAIELTGDQITIRGDGIIKMVAGDDCDSVLRVSGDYNWIEGITVDGNDSGLPAGRGECIRITGSYNTVHGVIAQNSSSTSNAGDDFMIFEIDPVSSPAIHNTLSNCTSINAGYNAFDNRGDYTTISNCQAIDFGKHGFNQAGGYTNQVTIEGLYCVSDSLDCTGIIIDPGSGNDNYVKQATLRNARVVLTGATATNSLSVVKFARIHDLHIEDCYFTAVADVSTAKIVEACKKVTIENSYLSANIDFDELGTGTAVTNSFSSVASNGGFVEITGTAHGHKKRDVIYIVSSVPGYTGLFEVTSTTANTFVIDCAWTTNTATGNWYDAQGEVILNGVQVGEPEMTRTNTPLSGLRTPRLKVHDCRFYGCRVRGIAAKNSYPITAIERYDIENCFFEFNRTGDSVTIDVLGGETFGTEFFTTSRKVRWVNNSHRNLSTGTVNTFESSDAKLFASSLDGGRDFVLSSGTLPSGTTVTWQVGDRFFKPSPTSGKSPGWVCTTAGTFSAGTFKPMPPISEGPLASNTTEVGNVGSGEDNLITYTLPANTLDNDGDAVEIEAAFTFAANGNNKTVKLYIGSDAVYDSGAVAQNGGSLHVRATLVRDSGVIAKVSSQAIASASSSFATKSTYFQTATAFASSNVIKGTGTATSDNDVVMEYLRVQKRPSP